MTEQTVRQVIEIAAPVVEVTLAEDRARVARRGVVTLPAGQLTLVVPGVAPVLADKTLQASVTAVADGGAVEIFDVRARRRMIAPGEARPAEREALEAEAAVLQLEELDLKDKIQLLSRQADVLSQLAGTVLNEMSDDAALGVAEPDEWQQQLQTIGRREREARAEVLERSFQWQDLKERSGRLAHRLAAAAHPGTEVAATVEVDLSVAEAGQLEVRLDYVVPAACWRPHHRATLVGEGDDGRFRIDFACDACVWQRSGEDWSDVALVLSTQRPSLGTEPPVLEDDVLRIRRRSEAVEVQVREQAVHTTGLGGRPFTAIPEVPGVDDGGVPLTLRAARTASIPSDGQPYRAPLFTFEAYAEAELVVAAELQPAAVLRTVQRNASVHPILAGPVDLVRRGGPAGRTSVLYVAPGERFALGWGPDGEVRAARSAEETEEERGMLSAWFTRSCAVEVRLSNIGARRKTLTVSERVPVSEIDKVKVAVDAGKTTRGLEPDEDGFVTWKVDIEPFETGKVELRYTLRKHRDVVGL
jgi:uncharacterized protein (TIGR02231 family)